MVFQALGRGGGCRFTKQDHINEAGDLAESLYHLRKSAGQMFNHMFDMS